jgi:hypothetical protein
LRISAWLGSTASPRPAVQIKATINGLNGDPILIVPECATNPLVAKALQRVQPRQGTIPWGPDAAFFTAARRK